MHWVTYRQNIQRFYQEKPTTSRYLCLVKSVQVGNFLKQEKSLKPLNYILIISTILFHTQIFVKKCKTNDKQYSTHC